MKKIMLSGCGGPAGVNVIRSLRNAPEKVYLVGTDINKYHLLWADTDDKWLVPKYTSSEYIDKINELADKTESDMIHPQPDGEVFTLSKNRRKLHCATFLPKHRTIGLCQDKFESAKIWKKAGIATTDSVLVKSVSDIDIAAQRIGYPFWLRATHGFSSRGSTLVKQRATAANWIRYWRSRDVPWDFVAHEYLPGRNIAFQSLWKNGELITSQARVRLEYIYPYLAPSGCTNTPVVAKTIHDDRVNAIATKCVKAIDKHATGIFCVDLRENIVGMPIPTEINAGRFFTTSYFFTAAGLNMPYYYVKLAYGEELPKLPKYNAIDFDLLWCRHIDCPAILIQESDVKFRRI